MSLTLSFTTPLVASAASTGGTLAIAEEKVTPGLLGLAVVASLGLALFFLIKSMNKQLRKIQVPTEEELEEQEFARLEAEAAASDKPED